MTDLNVDDFFADTAKVLDLLYQNFPTPVIVYVEDICGEDDVDEFGMHSKRYLGCHSCLLWLGVEGYIRFGDSIRTEAVDQAVLTGRCFTLLSTPLSPISLTDIEADQLAQSVALERLAPIFALRAARKPKDSVAIRQTMLAFMAQMQET